MATLKARRVAPRRALLAVSLARGVATPRGAPLSRRHDDRLIERCQANRGTLSVASRRFVVDVGEVDE